LGMRKGGPVRGLSGIRGHHPRLMDRQTHQRGCLARELRRRRGGGV
jgi:hypothetical protein